MTDNEEMEVDHFIEKWGNALHAAGFPRAAVDEFSEDTRAVIHTIFESMRAILDEKFRSR